MTYKQQVLRVYPQAYVSWCNFIFVLGTHECLFRTENVMDNGLTEKDAWEGAWKNIQKEMLKKLED